MILHPVFNASGIALDVELKKGPKDIACDDAEDDYFLLSLSFKKNEEEFRKVISSFEERCKDGLGPKYQLFKWIKEERIDKKLSRKNLIKKLKRLRYPKWKQKTILKIYDKKVSERFREKTLERFFNYVDTYEQERGRQEQLNILSDLKRGRNTFFYDVATVMVANKIKNYGWGNKILRKIFNRSPFYYFLNGPSFPYDSKLDAKVGKALYSAVAKLHKSYNEPALIEMLSYYMEMAIGKKFQKDIENYPKISWSLQNIRKRSRTFYPGKRNAPFWFSVLYERSVTSEVNDYVLNYVDKTIIEELDKEVLWIFLFVPPNTDEKKNLLVKIATDLKKSKDFYDRWVYLELSKQRPFLDSLQKIDPELKRPYFQRSRKFYHDALDNGQAVNFAIYNLLKMGDVSDDFIWWSIL